MRIFCRAVSFRDSVNYLCALMPISNAPFGPSNSCAPWTFLCSRNLSLLLRISDLSIFAHFGPLYFCAFWTSISFAHYGPLYLLRIMDLYIFCALWTFLLLRILNSINYDCPCKHFIVAHYGPFCCCAFWIQLTMTARVYILLLRIIILSISRIFLYNHH